MKANDRVALRRHRKKSAPASAGALFRNHCQLAQGALAENGEKETCVALLTVSVPSRTQWGPTCTSWLALTES
jgi:hypothetical protein